MEDRNAVNRGVCVFHRGDRIRKRTHIIIDLLFIVFVITLTVLAYTKPWLKERDDVSVPANVFYDFPDDKLWAHRALTVNEANRLLKIFPGVELDIVFEDGVYDVRHDTEDPTTGLSLDGYLNGIENVSDHYYWLDLKLLDEDNALACLERMEHVLEKYDLYDRAIVEAQNPDALDVFSRAGIFTSHWVSYIDAVDYERQVQSGKLRYDFNALSGSFTMYDSWNKYFPKSNFHLWTNTLETEEDKEIIRELASHENIRIILVDYDDNFLKN